MRQAYANHPLLVDQHLGVSVVGPPVLVFDWTTWSSPLPWTALVFFVVNRGAGDVVATPEISPDGVYPVSVGLAVPAALTVPAGQASADPYGVDLVAPFWRLWLSGTSTCDVYVYAIPRATMSLPELA